VVVPLLLLLLEVEPPLLLPLVLELLDVVPPSGEPPLLVPVPLDEELLDPPASSSPASTGGWPVASIPPASMVEPKPLLEDEHARRKAPAPRQKYAVRNDCRTDTMNSFLGKA
jgi:hypothetical protein